MNADGPVLRDIHLPSAAWWPLAPGWWLLAVLVLLAVAAGVWFARRRMRRRPLAAALREIDRLAAAFAHDGDAAALVDGASRLLRRVALRVAPDAAAQAGASWQAFVQSHASDAGTRRALDEFARERFRAQPVLDAPALLAALRAWCRSALRRRMRGSATPRSDAHAGDTRATPA